MDSMELAYTLGDYILITLNFAPIAMWAAICIVFVYKVRNIDTESDYVDYR